MRRITAKIDEYEKDGETKGRYQDIGVILSNDNGDYILLDPTVNLAGVMMRQRLLNPKKASKSVMCSVFDNDRDSKPSQQSGVGGPSAGADGFDDDIPFAPLGKEANW